MDESTSESHLSDHMNKETQDMTNPNPRGIDTSTLHPTIHKLNGDNCLNLLNILFKAKARWVT